MVDSMTHVHYEHSHLDVACELEVAEAGARAAEWSRLRDEAGLGAEVVPGGVRLWLRPPSFDAAADLARREASCCGFLDFELASGSDRLRLDITSAAAEATPVIACLTGLEPGCALGCC